MTISETAIKDLLIIKPKIITDERGYFFESYRYSVLEEYGVKDRFVQENESKSGKNILRGLHLQAPPFGQAKLLRVVSGAIFDVAVDVRKNSPTYGQHVSLELNETNKYTFYIPEGFAHGFCALENDTVVQYKCSTYYNKASECGIQWDDPILNIQWPVKQPVISEKDKHHPPLRLFKSPF